MTLGGSLNPLPVSWHSVSSAFCLVAPILTQDCNFLFSWLDPRTFQIYLWDPLSSAPSLSCLHLASSHRTLHLSLNTALFRKSQNSPSKSGCALSWVVPYHLVHPFISYHGACCPVLWHLCVFCVCVGGKVLFCSVFVWQVHTWLMGEWIDDRVDGWRNECDNVMYSIWYWTF